MLELALLFALLLAVTSAYVWFHLRRGARPLPAKLQIGQTFPDVVAIDEHGNPVCTADLLGSQTVILFVRGNWCPFCSAQVKDLTEHYRQMTDIGATLIFITPKPLETTRRVASFYAVEFDFWLDEDLKIIRELGLLMHDAVPRKQQAEYGTETVWPAAVVLDSDNRIVYARIASSLRDRPSAKALLGELRAGR